MKSKVGSPGNIIKAKILVNENSAKTWAFIIYVIVLSLFLIGNTQSYEAKVFKVARLTHEVKMLRAEFVDTRSELMELKMESTITKSLEEKGILPSEIPATKIRVTQKIKEDRFLDKIWR